MITASSDRKYTITASVNLWKMIIGFTPPTQIEIGCAPDQKSYSALAVTNRRLSIVDLPDETAEKSIHNVIFESGRASFCMVSVTIHGWRIMVMFRPVSVFLLIIEIMYFREEIGESLTLKFAESARLRREQNQPIISLGLGEPDFDTPSAVVEATIAKLRSGNSSYSSPLGLPALRAQIAGRLVAENSIPAEPGNILVAAGAKQAFQIVLLAMLQPEDEVVVVEPAFVSFIPQIYLAEPACKVRTVDVSPANHQLPMDALAAVVNDRTRAIVINTPNNPAGYVWSESQLREIYRLADQHDCFIISDEVYEKLVFDDCTHFSIGSVETDVSRVVTINGYSKSHAMTGWRLGYACYPASLNSKILKIQQHMNTNTCTFVQAAMAEVEPTLDMSYLTSYCQTLKKRRDTVAEVINETPGLSLVPPASGFFAFINIEQTGMDSNAYCASLLEKTGVATTPGLAFGKHWDDHIRLSYATDDVVLSEGMALLQGFTREIAK